MRLHSQLGRELTSCKAFCDCHIPPSMGISTATSSQFWSTIADLVEGCHTGPSLLNQQTTAKGRSLKQRTPGKMLQYLEAKLLKDDAESSVCIYDQAMRSLPLHTSTQRCDRCTCTHAHTQLAQRYDRCWCIHLHNDTIAAIAHTYTAIRSLSLHASTQRYDRCQCTCQHIDTIAFYEQSFNAFGIILKH